MRSALYTGTVMHARKTPKENVFRYRVCFYLLDLDELPEFDRRLRLFGWNRRNVVSLYDRDHMDVRAYLAEHGIEADRILLLTNLRVLGYVFNPVSFFYCYRDGGLACIVAEVSNTSASGSPTSSRLRIRSATNAASPTVTTSSCTFRRSSASTRATSGGSRSPASGSTSGSTSVKAPRGRSSPRSTGVGGRSPTRPSPAPCSAIR